MFVIVRVVGPPGARSLGVSVVRKSAMSDSRRSSPRRRPLIEGMKCDEDDDGPLGAISNGTQAHHPIDGRLKSLYSDRPWV